MRDNKNDKISNNPSINLKNIEELPPLNLRDPTLFKRGINEWLVSYTPQLNDYPQATQDYL